MKKALILCLSLLLVFAVVGCSNEITSGSIKMDTLKKLTLTYSVSDDNLVLEGYDDIDSVIQQFFDDNSNKGLIAEIVPIEYIFYYTIDMDEDTGELYLDGYAECKCSIQKVSQKYNLTNYSEKEIFIRQDVFLEPMNEENAIEMLKSIGAYKSGSYIEGTYKVPGKFINTSDYRLNMSDTSLLLLGEKPYYAFITFNSDIAYLYMLSDGSNEKTDDVPDDITASINNFKKFLTNNDSDLLN